MSQIDYKKEYYIKNKEKILKQRKNYIANNQKKIKKYNKLKREKNKTKCLCEEMLARAKRRSCIKNIKFDLSINDVFNIIPSFCPYLLVPFTNFSEVKNINYSMSLDRIDNNEGYVKNNIQIISFRANSIKNNATLFELENLIKWIENWQEENNDPKIISQLYDEIFLKKIYLNKKKHGKFNLSFEEFTSKFPISKKCSVFNFNFCFDNHIKYNSVSIDKFCPDLGYEKNNISIISRKANTIKSNANLNELKQMFFTWKNQTRDI